jgi:hypothetical protein
MKAPRRWVDDPEVDPDLRHVLRGAPAPRPLDEVTRRRLGVKVLHSSALPVAAAGWLFVKSAAAALGVVLGTGAIAVSTGIVTWAPATTAPLGAPSSIKVAAPPTPPRPLDLRPAVTPPQDESPLEPPTALLNPTPSLPIAPIASASGTLSAEAALLEHARRQVRSAPALALADAAAHATRFPRGQLVSERTLIQIEALHRLGRDAEARALANKISSGPSADLYAERVRALLGEKLVP